MADRPIIFSAPMVRALLAGTKTQTRRLIKAAVGMDFHRQTEERHFFGLVESREDGLSGVQLPCLPFAPGDRLYVRENWQTSDDLDDVKPSKLLRSVTPILYKADGQVVNIPRRTVAFSKTRPCIHMPRWASRLTLTVTEVRVQRLRSISERDARAEGLEQVCVGGLLPAYRGTPDLEPRLYPDSAYGDLWDSLHTAPGTRWADDPFVVAVSFDVAHGNIDGGQ